MKANVVTVHMAAFRHKMPVVSVVHTCRPALSWEGLLAAKGGSLER